MSRHISVKQFTFLTFTLALMVMIFCNSSLPKNDSAVISNGLRVWIGENLGIHMSAHFIRKAAHFAEFALLGLCLVPAVGDNVLPKIARRFLLAACIGVLFAVSDEVHQIFVPGRACEFRDMCIDFSGVICGAGLSMLIHCKKPSG